MAKIIETVWTIRFNHKGIAVCQNGHTWPVVGQPGNLLSLAQQTCPTCRNCYEKWHSVKALVQQVSEADLGQIRAG